LKCVNSQSVNTCGKRCSPCPHPGKNGFTR
jgi:hypothetical protein